MRTTKLNELRSALQDLAIPRDRVVMVHSGLLKFGLVEGGVRGVADLLQDILGPRATIVMPAFTFAFTRTATWHSRSSPSEVGALTEFFRRLPESRRSLHPIHSVCAVGPLAAEITGGRCLSSFGDQSAFDVLERMDALNLSLGTEFEGGATFLHRAEEDLRVPYRSFKKFPGDVYDGDGARVDETFTMYARIITDEYEYATAWDECWSDLNAAGVFRVTHLRGAMFTLCEIKATLQAFRTLLLANPFYVARLVAKLPQ